MGVNQGARVVLSCTGFERVQPDACLQQSSTADPSPPAQKCLCPEGAVPPHACASPLMYRIGCHVSAEDGDEVITRAKTAPAASSGNEAKLEVDAKGSSNLAVGRSQSAPLPLCDRV